MAAVDHVYGRKALEAIPRLLTLQDRNPFSPTYGCFHRDYWLYKTSDFPDAVRQFGCHALALIYSYPLPGNSYYQKAAIAEWALAGLNFWARIQHSDGSFDEFYPYERGWVGPTAFTTYTSIETYRLLEPLMDGETQDRVRSAIKKAAYFIAGGEAEEDHLANHHAMACLSVWKAARLLDEKSLYRDFEKLWEGFLNYQNEEGWSREYDGPDPGYLSATISFIAKIYQDGGPPDLIDTLRPAVAFSSYFVYPDGSYGGTLGSRNTQHFYPHGFEILANKIPLAAAVAAATRNALAKGSLVPPEIMSDRYLFYRVPEFLLSQIDHSPPAKALPLLPFERGPFRRYFPAAGIVIAREQNLYLVANLRKGGVFKVFDLQRNKLLRSDCGVLVSLDSRSAVSSQWIAPSDRVVAGDGEWSVRGNLQKIPSHRVFTLSKNVLFRIVLLLFGWIPHFSHRLKGWIRRILMTGSRPTGFTFERRIRLQPQALLIEDCIQSGAYRDFERLIVGGEYAIRYVPQSRFFQAEEMDVASQSLIFWPHSHQRSFRLKRRIDERGEQLIACQGLEKSGARGIYGEEYFRGRTAARQLSYRLSRRTDEVARVLEANARSLRMILDVGTADGLMIDRLAGRFPGLSFYGIDRSQLLLKSVANGGAAARVQADALFLPAVSGVFDAVIACALEIGRAHV